MLPHFLPNGRECIGKGNDVTVFRAFTYFSEARVITVLLAAFRVATRGLDMAVRIRANPDVLPCRWDGQRPDTPENFRLGESRPVGPSIRKTASSILPADARPGIGDIPQAHRLGSILRVDKDLCAIRGID
jgi:hypothetical protein